MFLLPDLTRSVGIMRSLKGGLLFGYQTATVRKGLWRWQGRFLWRTQGTQLKCWLGLMSTWPCNRNTCAHIFFFPESWQVMCTYRGFCWINRLKKWFALLVRLIMQITKTKFKHNGSPLHSQRIEMHVTGSWRSC